MAPDQLKLHKDHIHIGYMDEEGEPTAHGEHRNTKAEVASKPP